MGIFLAISAMISFNMLLRKQREGNREYMEMRYREKRCGAYPYFSRNKREERARELQDLVRGKKSDLGRAGLRNVAPLHHPFILHSSGLYIIDWCSLSTVHLSSTASLLYYPPLSNEPSSHAPVYFFSLFLSLISQDCIFDWCSSTCTPPSLLPFSTSIKMSRVNYYLYGTLGLHIIDWWSSICTPSSILPFP